MNGDGVNNDLIYIPKTKDEIKFTSAEDADAFEVRESRPLSEEA